MDGPVVSDSSGPAGYVCGPVFFEAEENGSNAKSSKILKNSCISKTT